MRIRGSLQKKTQQHEGVQATTLRDSSRDCIKVDGADISQGLDVVDVTANDLNKRFSAEGHAEYDDNHLDAHRCKGGESSFDKRYHRSSFGRCFAFPWSWHFFERINT